MIVVFGGEDLVDVAFGGCSIVGVILAGCGFVVVICGCEWVFSCGWM